MADHGGLGDDGFRDGFHRHIANDRRGFVNANKRNIAELNAGRFCRLR
jgi:hypothetical protein